MDVKIQTYKQKYKKTKKNYDISHMEIHANGRHWSPFLYIVDTDGDYHYVKAMTWDLYEQILYDPECWLNQNYTVKDCLITTGVMPW